MPRGSWTRIPRTHDWHACLTRRQAKRVVFCDHGSRDKRQTGGTEVKRRERARPACVRISQDQTYV